MPDEIITCPKCGYHVRGPEQWGCHCDLEPGAQPDACVLDGRAYLSHREPFWCNCVFAEKLHKEGKGKEACKYWKKW